MPDGTIPLSALIDRLAGNSEARDELFVRAFTRWLGERSAHLRLPVVERLGLGDVVITFKMKERVRLIVTGYPPDGLPGEVTLTVDERDFPFVQVCVSAEPRPDPYEICTLDYGPAGRRVRIETGSRAGAHGILVVAATIGDRQENRVQLEDGTILTLPGEVLSFIE